MILENKKYLSFSHNLADITGKVLVKNYKSQNIIVLYNPCKTGNR